MARGPLTRLMAATAAAVVAVASASARHARADTATAPVAAATSSASRRAAADPGAIDVAQQFAAAWRGELPETIRALLAPGEIRFRLDPPGADVAARGGDAPPLSAAQVFYMLQNHFAAVHTLEARLERRVANSGPDQAHGVMLVQWAVDASAPPVERRLFLGLRLLDGGWRVVEVRALP